MDMELIPIQTWRIREGLNRNRMRWLIRQGKLPAVRVGRQWMISRLYKCPADLRGRLPYNRRLIFPGLALGLVLSVVPAQAFDLKGPHFPVKDYHPLVYKAAKPIRMTWNSCIWIGEKGKPIKPFIDLCGSIGNCSTPFVVGAFK